MKVIFSNKNPDVAGILCGIYVFRFRDFLPKFSFPIHPIFPALSLIQPYEPCPKNCRKFFKLVIQFCLYIFISRDTYPACHFLHGFKVTILSRYLSNNLTNSNRCSNLRPGNYLLRWNNSYKE